MHHLRHDGLVGGVVYLYFLTRRVATVNIVKLNVVEIGCMDLFPGGDSRERVVIFTIQE